jgi:hypothetical protein
MGNFPAQIMMLRVSTNEKEVSAPKQSVVGKTMDPVGS